MSLPNHPEKRKREARKEEKAEEASALDKFSIEKELLERLKNGVYVDIYNYPFNEYERILEDQADSEEEEPEIEYVEGYDGLEEDDDVEDFGGFAMERSHKASAAADNHAVSKYVQYLNLDDRKYSTYMGFIQIQWHGVN